LIYEYVLNLATRLSLKLQNALLSKFVRLGNLADAWYVFGKMEESDVFSWNILVGRYARYGYFDEALDLYNKMLKSLPLGILLRWIKKVWAILFSCVISILTMANGMRLQYCGGY
jgi:pentatricopeptide repeat protein